MTITRAQIAKQLVPGLNAVFGLAYKDVAEEHLKLFEVQNSVKAFEEAVLQSGMGTAAVKTEGSAVSYDNMQESYTARWTHETIATAFAITEEAFEDNLYDTFAKARTKEIARSMANAKQVKAANIFNNGHSTSYPIGDGAAFFSAAHPTVGDGNQSNTVAADLSETALENACIAIAQMKNDRGILINAQPKMLLVPVNNMFVADRLLESTLRPGKADNDINAIKNTGMFPEGYVVNHRLTDTNAWYIKTDVPEGTKMFQRRALKTAMEGDFDTGNLRYKASERYSFGVMNWRGWYGSNGA